VEVWPGVREGVENVGRIVTENPAFMPNVLASLLAGRYQLWMVMDDDRLVYGFLITCVSDDPLTNEVFLMIEMVYGFRTSTEEMIHDVYAKLCEYAAAYGCNYIKATTNVARAAELLELVGMREVSKNYVARII
jgi:hypothetical protein